MKSYEEMYEYEEGPKCPNCGEYALFPTDNALVPYSLRKYKDLIGIDGRPLIPQEKYHGAWECMNCQAEVVPANCDWHFEGCQGEINLNDATGYQEIIYTDTGKIEVMYVCWHCYDTAYNDGVPEKEWPKGLREY